MTKAEKMLEDIEAIAGNLRDEIRTTMDLIAKAAQADRLIDENRNLRTTIDDLREANAQLCEELSLAAEAKLKPAPGPDYVTREEMTTAILEHITSAFMAHTRSCHNLDWRPFK